LVLQGASHRPVHTVGLFEGMLKQWYFWATHSRITPMIQAARSAGQANSLIQAAKAKARGFRTFRDFRMVAFLITGKPDFKRRHPHDLPT
jgi:transposase